MASRPHRIVRATLAVATVATMLAAPIAAQSGGDGRLFAGTYNGSLFVIDETDLTVRTEISGTRKTIMMGFNTEAGWVLIGASMIGSVFVLILAISVFQEIADSVPPGDDRTAQVEVAIGQLAGVVSGVVAPLSFLLWGVAFFNTLAWPILE